MQVNLLANSVPVVIKYDLLLFREFNGLFVFIIKVLKSKLSTPKSVNNKTHLDSDRYTKTINDKGF